MKDMNENHHTSVLDKVRSMAGIAQSVVTVGAIIIAGIWFLLQGMASPRANIAQVVTHRQITDKWTWIYVSITISNEGKRRLDLKSGIIRIQKILPLDPKISEIIGRNESPISQEAGIVLWPRIGDLIKPQIDLKIESGESDKFDYEFIVPSYVQTVKIYSYFERQKDPSIGWSATTIYDLKRKGDKING